MSTASERVPEWLNAPVEWGGSRFNRVEAARMCQPSAVPLSNSHVMRPHALLAQANVPASQALPQLVPSQVAWALAGASQGRQRVPHVAGLLLSTQSVPQACSPAPHATPHFVPSQMAVPLAGVGQGMQLVGPQLAVLLLLAQTLPQRWKPAAQATPHLMPSQVADPLTGTGHGEQLVPQLAGSPSDMQRPLQSCLPAGQRPSHERFASMQTSPQTSRPGHAMPHLPPWHVAMPLRGTGQGVHDVPHVSGSLLSAQVEPQR
jgi:hypothetical protein